jgi:hypothetical protein
MLALPSAPALAASLVFLVRNINSEAGFAHPNRMPSCAATNGKVFFVGRTAVPGEELRISDGTAESPTQT